MSAARIVLKVAGSGVWDPAGGAGGGLVQQPGSEPGVTGAVVASGVGEHGGGLGRGVGGQREPGLAGQVAKIAASWAAV